MKQELLLINFHDNDFYVSMCKTAEFLLREFKEEGTLPSTHLENYKNAVPRIMAIYHYIGFTHAGSTLDELKHYEDYFSKHTTYLTDYDEIVEHIKKYNMGYGNVPTEESGIYNKELFNDNPYEWLYDLKLNLNAEALLIMFIDDGDDSLSCKYRVL